MNFTSFNSSSKRNSIIDNKDLKKGHKISQKKHLKHKLAAANIIENGYLFPSISIRIINAISSMKEIESQTIAIGF